MVSDSHGAMAEASIYLDSKSTVCRPGARRAESDPAQWTGGCMRATTLRAARLRMSRKADLLALPV